MTALLRACLYPLLLLPLLAHSEFELIEAAPGVFVHRGAHEDSTAGIANLGVVVGEKCAAVIDTGGSLSEGEKLKQAIRAKTKVPVCYVINTHVHPDHVFGNAAFKDVEFIGHAKLPAAVAARGQTYLNATKRDLGEAAAGTEIVPPTRLVSDKLDLDLGGRVIKITAWPTAHTDHDLTVFDERTQTLWLSDLLFVERVPVVDGSVKGWLDVIDKIRGIPAQLVVPGHGWVKGGWRDALAKQEAYLQALVQEARAAIKRGDTIQQAVKTLAQSARQDWLLFDSNHPRNVTTVYAELEWE